MKYGIGAIIRPFLAFSLGPGGAAASRENLRSAPYRCGSVRMRHPSAPLSVPPGSLPGAKNEE